MHRRLGKALALLVCTLGAGVAAVSAWVAWPLPAGMVALDPAPAVMLQDRHGVPLRVTRAHDGSRSRWIPLTEMDPDIIAAFVAVEDRRFFSHWGVDATAAMRAARDNLAAGRVVSGASTITMQTARLLRATPRSWRGKVAQALWALRMEWGLDKQQILE
ncbi:MAG: transglycosylase domain-containing protein, partial [Gemmatimonadaceae bacterium]